ncbi:MAG: lipoyl(octanoyl) transferase LipB, partial [Candidatus Methylomirabilales bacterium]
MQELRIVRAGLVPYAVASEWQEVLCRRRWRDEIPDVLLLLEHPHVYTLGRRFSKQHLLADQAFLAARGIEVQECDRGGSITYHGPGQLVGYPILDLRRPRGSRAGNDPEPRPDAIRYLRTLEEALIRAVRSLGVIAGRRPGLTGVWVGEAKLASIGVNVSRGVSKHGFAMNVATDLSYFEGIVA